MKNQHVFTSSIKLSRVKSDRDFGRQYAEQLHENNHDQKYTSKAKTNQYFKGVDDNFFNEKQVIQNFYIDSMRLHFTTQNESKQSIPNYAHPDNLVKSMAQNILKRQRIQQANRNLRYQLQSKDQKIKELITKQTSRPSIRNSLNQNSIFEIEAPGNSLKSVKNQEFIFRIKLKFISALQQLQIQKDVIQSIRNLQIDTEILQAFVNSVKEKFNNLKISNQETSQSNGKSAGPISAVQKIQFISLQNQAIQYQQNQKRLKAKLHTITTQYSQIAHKYRLKDAQSHDLQTQAYQLNMNVKQNQRVIQKLQNQLKSKDNIIKGLQKKYKQEKQAISQALNRQMQQKSNYLTKWQSTQYESFEYQHKLKIYQQSHNQLEKEALKWKQRVQWQQKEEEIKQKQSKKRIQQFQKVNIGLVEQNKVLRQQLQKSQKLKQEEKSKATSNKVIQKIIQEWKAKLIQNVDAYQKQLQAKEEEIKNRQAQQKILQKKIRQLQFQNSGLNDMQKQNKQKTSKDQQALSNLQKTLKQVSERATIQAELVLIHQKQKQKIKSQFQAQIQIVKRQKDNEIQRIKSEKQQLEGIVLNLKMNNAVSEGLQDKISSLTANFKVKETVLNSQIQRLHEETDDLKFRIKKTAQLQGQYLNQIKALQQVVSKVDISKPSQNSQNMPQNVKRMYFRVQANSPQHSRYTQRYLSQKSQQNSNRESRQTIFSKSSQETTQK